MHLGKLSSGGSNTFLKPAAERWNTAMWVAAGSLVLAAGCAYLSAVTTYLGLFPTMFLGTVIAACVAMHLAELATSEQA